MPESFAPVYDSTVQVFIPLPSPHDPVSTPVEATIVAGTHVALTNMGQNVVFIDMGDTATEEDYPLIPMCQTILPTEGETEISFYSPYGDAWIMATVGNYVGGA